MEQGANTCVDEKFDTSVKGPDKNTCFRWTLIVHCIPCSLELVVNESFDSISYTR